MQLKKGKLYRVKSLHPEKVHEPLDLCFYPSVIEGNGRLVRLLRAPDGSFQDSFLEVGDIFLLLGNLGGTDTWSYNSEYLTILFGEKIFSSNCSSKTTLSYYEIEQVGNGI